MNENKEANNENATEPGRENRNIENGNTDRGGKTPEGEAMAFHAEAENGSLPCRMGAENGGEDGVAGLQREIGRLKAELDTLRREKEDRKRFSYLFPDADFDNVIPEAGLTRTATYALDLLTRKKERETANRQGKHPDSADGNGYRMPKEEYSFDEVKGMSQKEVHSNFDRINKSMKSWFRK